MNSEETHKNAAGDKGPMPPGADARTQRANLRTDQANARTEKANTRTDQANARTADAKALTEKAELRTERVEAQSEALRSSEISYRRLFESARDGILILEAETGRIADANPFLVELLGFSHGEMVGKTVGELSPFRDIVSNQAMLERLQNDGYVRYDDLPLETRDGRQIAVEFVSNVYHAGDRKVIQCNIRDISGRKQAQAALRKSELELKEAQRLAHVGSWWLGVGSDEVAWTEELYRMLRLDPGQPPPPYPEQHRLFTPESWQLLSAAIPRTMETGEPYELELEMVRADGSKGWMLARGERLQNAGGVVLGLRGVAQDITKRKQMELALKASKRRLRGIIDGVGLSMFVGLMTPEGVLIEANVPALAAAGLKLEDVLGKPFEETYWWAYSPEVQEQLRQAIARGARGEASRYDARLRVGENQFADVDFSLQPLRDETGEIVFLIPSASVITERKQAEKELRRKTALLEAQLDSSLDGILIVDDQGNKILQNQRMREVWKIPPEVTANVDDAVQIEFVTKRTKNPRQFADKVAYLYAHPEEVSRDEIELIDGTVLDRYASPIRDKAGKYYGRIWTFRDITEHRKLELQIRQTQKMESIGQLAGGIAHDFNNIMGVIMLQSELAESVQNTPQKVLDDLLEIRAAAKRAANLTRQLLLFSRQQVMQLQQLDLNDVVTNLASMLRRVIREDVRLKLHLHSARLMTYADVGMLDQLLMNLAVNARDAMPAGGRLLIETAEKIIDEEQAAMNLDASPGRYVWLSVSDTGCGISPELQSHIFEPFFTTKEVGEGTGLGLATVFGIVKQHHGWIKVYSEVGRGTNFQIYLPASNLSAEVPAKEPAKAQARGGSETILVAEDDASLRRLTRAVLEQIGYHVLEAANGEEAQRAWSAHQGQVDLLVTDLVMPGSVDGRELATRLQRQKPGLKVIFTSGYSAEIAGRELKLQSKQIFLQKPCSRGHLLAAVRDCLDS